MIVDEAAGILIVGSEEGKGMSCATLWLKELMNKQIGGLICMNKELFRIIRENLIETTGFLDGLLLSQTDDGNRSKIGALRYRVQEAVIALKELENQKEGRTD